MIPRLTTSRLVLDAFTLADVPEVVELAGHPEIYATTLLIERPYKPEHAQVWIASHLPKFLSGDGVVFAVRLEGRLIGGVGLALKKEHDLAGMGYWMGRPFWGNGYATEAVGALMAFGFRHFSLEKIEAEHFASNLSSGRVMEKNGMTREGFQLHHRKKDGVYVDVFLYGVTRGAFEVKHGTLVPFAAGQVAQIADAPSGGPPRAESLADSNVGSLERALVTRHFSGKTVGDISAELRVYGKSLAPDFGRLSDAALAYYLPAARAYLESKDADGDWDFAFGLVQSLSAQLGGGALRACTRAAAVELVRHVHDSAARYQIETDKQPFAGWVKAALE